MPDETPEQRDERVAAENVERDARRRKVLDAAEARNALRVHLAVDDVTISGDWRAEPTSLENAIYPTGRPAADETPGE